MATDIPELQERINREMTRNPDADWQREKADGLTSSLVKGKHGSWRRMFTQQDLEIFNGIAGDILKSWNYELEAAEKVSSAKA